MILDHLAGHVGGDAAEEDADAGDAVELLDRLVDQLLRHVAQARVVDDVEGLVLEGQVGHVAEEVAVQPLLRRLGMDVARVLDAPGVDADIGEALQGEAEAEPTSSRL